VTKIMKRPDSLRDARRLKGRGELLAPPLVAELRAAVRVTERQRFRPAVTLPLNADESLPEFGLCLLPGYAMGLTADRLHDLPASRVRVFDPPGAAPLAVIGWEGANRGSMRSLPRCLKKSAPVETGADASSQFVSRSVGSVALPRDGSLELALAHLRAALDPEALRLPVELLLGALLTRRHGSDPLSVSGLCRTTHAAHTKTSLCCAGRRAERRGEGAARGYGLTRRLRDQHLVSLAESGCVSGGGRPGRPLPHHEPLRERAADGGDDVFAAVAVTDVLERLDLVEVDHRNPELVKADHGAFDADEARIGSDHPGDVTLQP
jgi:hypothetical protein